MSQPGIHVNAQADLAAWITNWVVRELRLSPRPAALEEPFTAYGVDSVHAMMLVGDLEEHLSLRLSPTLAWEYPTVEKLAEYLSLLPPDAVPEAIPESINDTDAALLAQLDQLTEEEIDRLLKERLGNGASS